MLDEAKARFDRVVEAFRSSGRDERPLSESAARLNLIDPILINVLGWPRSLVELAQRKALIFGSLDHIERGFEHFYYCLSYSGRNSGYLHRALAPRPRNGLLNLRDAEPAVQRWDIRAVGHQNRASFHHELEQAFDEVFRPIQHNPTALERCFVESHESKNADSRLERFAELLSEPLRVAPESYQGLVEGDAETVREPLPDDVRGHRLLRPPGRLVRLVGQPSSGKSVYLRRFYSKVLGRSTKEKLAIVGALFAAEQELAASYVDYVLRSVQKATPVGYEEKLPAMASFERTLAQAARQRWR